MCVTQKLFRVACSIHVHVTLRALMLFVAGHATSHRNIHRLQEGSGRAPEAHLRAVHRHRLRPPARLSQRLPAKREWVEHIGARVSFTSPLRYMYLSR